MDIVIVGAGNVGRALGGGWRKAGHKVTLAVRDTSGAQAAELKQQGFSLVEPKDAAKAGDVIVLSVPWPALANAVQSPRAPSGKLVIAPINPLAPHMSLALA